MPKKNNKEFIELLINEVIDDNQRDFVKAFNDFLERMPDFHASGKVKGQGKTKKGEETTNWFQPSCILGGIFGFANSELKQTLEVSDIHWKLDDSGKVLNLSFKREDNSFTSRTFIFGDDQVHNPLAVYSGKTFRIKPKQSGGGFEIAPENVSGSVAFSETKLENLAFNKIDTELGSHLEVFIEKLGSENLEIVKRKSKKFLGNIDELYQGLLNHVSPRNIEAMQHGFFYGVLTLPFKNRFAIDAYVERIAGKGYTDLIFIVRGDNPTQAIPILLEFKSGAATIVDGLNQIESQVYFNYFFSLRSYAKKFVAYGLNLEAATGQEKIQMYAKHDVPEAKNVIASILTAVAIEDNERAKQELLHILKRAYLSYYGNHDATHFNRLLLGHLLSLDNQIAHDKKIFLFDNILDSRRGTFAIVVDQSTAGSNSINRVILNIIDINTRRGAENVIPLLSLDSRNIDKTVKIDVKINTLEKKQEAFFQAVSIDLGTKAISNEQLPYAGRFVSLGDIDVSEFITFNEREPKEVLFDIKNFTKRLIEKTFDVREFLKKEQPQQYNEKDFHALVHGILGGLPKFEKDGKVILVRVFSEPNLSVAGRIDLALTLAVEQQGVIAQERLYIFELKYAISDSEANKILNPKSESESGSAKPEKVKQVYKYLKNAKSLTDEKEATVCTLVVYPRAENKDKFLQLTLGTAAIDHSSAMDTLPSSQESLPKKSDSRVASQQAGPSNQQTSLSGGRTRTKSRSRTGIKGDTVSSDSSPDNRPRLRENKALSQVGPSQAVDTSAISGQSGSNYDASSSGSSPDKRSGRKRTSSSALAQETQAAAPPRKRKQSCRASKKGSRSKREVDISQGLCVLSTEMQAHKKTQQKKLHALYEVLGQQAVSRHIHVTPSAWHIPLTTFNHLDSATNIDTITRAFSASVSKQKEEIFLHNLQTTQELAQRLEQNKVWSDQEALQFDEFVQNLQVFNAVTPRQSIKTSMQ